MSKNNYCSTGNLLDYFYHQNHYKLIGIYLSRQTNTSFFPSNEKKMMVQQIFDLQKKLNLLNEANDSKVVPRKWNIVNDQSNANYNVRNGIIYNTEVLKSNLCDYNDAYILVRGNIVTTAHSNPTQ